MRFLSCRHWDVGPFPVPVGSLLLLASLALQSEFGSTLDAVSTLQQRRKLGEKLPTEASGIIGRPVHRWEISET